MISMVKLNRIKLTIDNIKKNRLTKQFVLEMHMCNDEQTFNTNFMVRTSGIRNLVIMIPFSDL